MNFKGTFLHTIDEKGRVSLPSKFRPFLGDAVVIAKIYKMCLSVFPTSEWSKFEKKLQNTSLTDEDAMDFRRIILSQTREVPIDKAGRVCIPPELREEVNLSADVAIVGNGNLIEIWDRNEFAEYISKTEKKRKELMSYMKNIGF